VNFDEFEDGKPNNPNLARRAARLRILGKTQSDIAEEIDVRQATISRWENADWWRHLAEEVASDFNDRLVGKARRQLLQALESEDLFATKDARWILERLGGDEFLPPRQRIEKEVYGEVETDEDETAWLEYLTTDEKRELLSHLERYQEIAESRMEE